MASDVQPVQSFPTHAYPPLPQTSPGTVNYLLIPRLSPAEQTSYFQYLLGRDLQVGEDFSYGTDWGPSKHCVALGEKQKDGSRIFFLFAAVFVGLGGHLGMTLRSCRINCIANARAIEAMQSEYAGRLSCLSSLPPELKEIIFEYTGFLLETLHKTIQVQGFQYFFSGDRANPNTPQFTLQAGVRGDIFFNENLLNPVERTDRSLLLEAPSSEKIEFLRDCGVSTGIFHPPEVRIPEPEIPSSGAFKNKPVPEPDFLMDFLRIFLDIFKACMNWIAQVFCCVTAQEGRE